MKDSIHPTLEGAAIISRNMAEFMSHPKTRQLNIRSLLSKSLLVIDIFCLSETWLRQEDHVSNKKSTLSSYLNFQIPQTTGRGVGAIFRSGLVISVRPEITF